MNVSSLRCSASAYPVAINFCSARMDLQRWLRMTSLPACWEKQNRRPSLARISSILHSGQVEQTTSRSWWPALTTPPDENPAQEQEQGQVKAYSAGAGNSGLAKRHQ